MLGTVSAGIKGVPTCLILLFLAHAFKLPGRDASGFGDAKWSGDVSIWGKILFHGKVSQRKR